MLLLLSFWIITGLMAEDLKVTYRLKNSSVCLNIENPRTHKSVKWTKYQNKIIVDGEEVNPTYKDKVFFDPVNLSLCINNLTDTDAGTYEVSYNLNFQSVSHKYQVIIQEMVPRPVIAMSEGGSNMSAGLCNIIVNCSIQDEWHLSVCAEDRCITSEKAFSKVNITIFIDNRSVICSGSNHVSTSNASKIMTKCFSEHITEEKEKPQQHLPIAALTTPFLISLLVLVLLLVILVKKQVSKKCKSYQQQTSTVRSIQSQPMGTLSPSQPRVSTGSSSSDADPAYENADIIEFSQTSSPREEMSSMERHHVDTVYCLRGGKASSASNTQSTPEAAAATVEETRATTQIDTVYSVLQKPKILNPQHHQEVKQDL